MINFFRNIRRQLANENKFHKYFKYALGEILLIVIGILIALQFNNWNESRIQNVQFNETLRKAYTSLNTNVEALNSYRHKLLNDFVLIETFIRPKDTFKPYEFNVINEYLRPILGRPSSYYSYGLIKLKVDSIKDWQKPHLLFMLETFALKINANELPYYNDILNPNPNAVQQNELTQKIVKFNSELNNASFLNSKRITNYLLEHGIPRPYSMQWSSSYFNWKWLNPQEFSKNEINLVNQMMDTDYFKSLLRDCVTNHIKEFAEISRLYEEGKNVLKIIKGYNPDITLDYANIGIIGDALDGWFESSTRLKQTSTEPYIWESVVTLKDGQVKFISDDSWINNWGGSQFPKGYLLYWGGDIPVKAGNYHVILNLTNNYYEFIKQDD